MSHDVIRRIVDVAATGERVQDTLKRLAATPLELSEARSVAEDIGARLASIHQRNRELESQLRVLKSDEAQVRAEKKALELVCPHDMESDSEGSMTISHCKICGKTETSDLSSSRAYSR